MKVKKGKNLFVCSHFVSVKWIAGHCKVIFLSVLVCAIQGLYGQKWKPHIEH